MGADLLPSPTVGEFTAKGGWWVVAQGLLLAALLAAWLLWGGGWGVAAVAGGAVLTGAGGALGAAGFLALGPAVTPYPEPLPGAALVERGAYRLARHPIYGGIVLGCAGVSLADGNWPGLVLASVLAGLFWAKAGFEERRLGARYPGYDAYRVRVPRRLIPWIL
jgi:protein-S-isoprenylcysteine O-methyltransferase Ste14